MVAVSLRCALFSARIVLIFFMFLLTALSNLSFCKNENRSCRKAYLLAS